MRRRFREIALVVMAVVTCTLCRADLPPEIVKQGKRATAFVTVEERDGISEGSAFCVDASGLFITNEHVIEDLVEGGSLTLILRSGEKDQLKMRARVLVADKEDDLAIIQAEGPLKITPLALGTSDGLVETMSVAVFGYPFGSDLALKDGEYPSISVSLGHITALRKDAGNLSAIQLDASVNPGNSGGPVLNQKGEVIGIVQEGIPGASLNFAIPVGFLHTVMKQLPILFTPPEVKPGHLFDGQDFRIQLRTPQKPGTAITVDLTLSADANDLRSMHAKSEDGRTFTVHAPLLPVRTGPTKLTVTASLGDTQISGEIADQKIQVGTANFSLSSISRIDFGSQTVVTFIDGRHVYGIVSGLFSSEVLIGNAKKTLNLAQFDTVEFAPIALPEYVYYEVTAKRDGNVFGELKGKLDVFGHVPTAFPYGALKADNYVRFPDNGHWYCSIATKDPITHGSLIF